MIKTDGKIKQLIDLNNIILNLYNTHRAQVTGLKRKTMMMMYSTV